MKISILIPVYARNQQHFDFLNRTISSIKSLQHTLVFLPVENLIEQVFRHQNYPDLPFGIERHPISGRQPQSVAKAWNDGIRESQKLNCDYVLILNQDIILRHDSIDKIVAFAQTTQPDIVMWTMGQHNSIVTLDSVALNEDFHEHPNFSSFLVKADFLDVMGNFDENFKPAYMEDNDMHARIALSNKKAIVYNGSLFYHFGSRTTGVDATLSSVVAMNFQVNGRYFYEKWGAHIVHEVEDMRKVYFKTPYNEPNRELSYWRG